MSLILVFQIVIVILGIGVLGFWVTRKRIIPSGPLGWLFNVSINVALPSFIFASIINDIANFEISSWWQLPLWFIVFSLVALALTLATMFISRKENRHEFAISLYFQNAMFYPLVILILMFGNDNPYLIYLILFTFLQPTIVFSTYTLFFRKQKVKLNIKRIINPVIIASLVAIAIGLIGAQNYLPNAVIILLEIIGGLATPLLLMILVSNIYNDFRSSKGQKRHFNYSEVLKFVLVKNILFPFVFLGLLLIIRPEYSIALIIILQGAAPPITAVPLLTERSGGNRNITNQFIIASFIFSVVSIPLVLFVFSRFFTAP